MSGFSQAFVEWLLGAMAVWGYPIVLGLTILESIFIVGSFVPGEVVIAAAAFTATQRAGSLDPVLIWVCAVAGAMIGTNISYLLGRRGGREMLEKWGPRFGMQVEAAEHYFEQHGTRTMFLGRWIAVFKNIVPVIAGASRMKVRPFEGYVFAGVALHAAVLTAIGWFLGENFQSGLKWVGAFGWVGFAVVLVLFASAVFGKRRYTKRRLARLEEEDEADGAQG